MDDVHNVPSEVLNGEWSKKWRDAQPRPAHLISNNYSLSPGEYYVECTCGHRFYTIEDWSIHATIQDANKAVG